MDGFKHAHDGCQCTIREKDILGCESVNHCKAFKENNDVEEEKIDEIRKIMHPMEGLMGRPLEELDKILERLKEGR
jgi:hypothetical protein